MIKFLATVTSIVITTLAIFMIGMRADAARTFMQALPGFKFSFPRDHASHDRFKTEWWYFTGHLSSTNGRKFGYELTFFRSALPDSEPGNGTWNLENVYLAHFALTDLNGKRFFFKELLNRKGLGLADARQDIPYVYNQGWSMEFIGDKIALRADTPDYSIHLLLDPRKPPAIHGADGVSQKASCKGCASHYYSMTHLDSSGTVFVKAEAVPVTGLSWMDHEFGSNQLTEKQVGWDWFSIQLNDNRELMLYLMRNADGTLDPNSSGTIINRDGSTVHLTKSDFNVRSSSSWVSPTTHARYPMGWAVSVPSLKLNLTLQSLMNDQELVTSTSAGVTYWEGACSVTGTGAGSAPLSGEAYVEMTGYAGRFNKNI